MDINFEKDKVTSDFKEAESLENIKSGERLSVIFGKIQRWFAELGVCVTEEDLQNALKDLPKRYYNTDGSIGGIDITPEYENNTASGKASFTSGRQNEATDDYSVAMGFINHATAPCSFAVGQGNRATGHSSIAMGHINKSSGMHSTAIGESNEATGQMSAAIGFINKSNGPYSFAVGMSNEANAHCAIAMGENNESNGIYSVAIGLGLLAFGKNQNVLGKYNIADNNNKYAFIIGNGTDEARSNALTLDWNGDLWLSGDVTATDTDGQEISLSALKSELSQTEINVMNVVKNQNNLIQSNNAEHTILHDSLGMQKKNWLKNTHSIGSTTINGITFTTNADGSVTANGTATADASYNMVVALPPNTSFILSGCPSGGSTSTYNIFAIETDSFTQAYRDTGNGAEFNTGSYTEWSFRIRVVSGQTVNDLTFYPMVRSTAVSDSEYAPYTDDLQTQINELRAQVAALTGAATVNEEDINNE